MCSGRAFPMVLCRRALTLHSVSPTSASSTVLSNADGWLPTTVRLRLPCGRMPMNLMLKLISSFSRDSRYSWPSTVPTTARSRFSSCTQACRPPTAARTPKPTWRWPLHFLRRGPTTATQAVLSTDSWNTYRWYATAWKHNMPVRYIPTQVSLAAPHRPARRSRRK